MKLSGTVLTAVKILALKSQDSRLNTLCIPALIKLTLEVPKEKRTMYIVLYNKHIRDKFLRFTPRNLGSRTSMLAQVLQILYGKEHLDLHPKQGNLLQRNIFTGLKQNLSLLHKIGWRPAEKNWPIFSTCVI
jgi:hypothetical protein